MKKIIFLISICLSFFGCTKHDKINNIVDIENIREIDIDKIVVVKTIQLETTSSNLLGVHLNVKFDKSNLWILDQNNPTNIFGFNFLGQSEGYTATVSEGPNSIFNIKDFFILNDTIVVLTNLGQEISVSFWDNNDTLLKKDKILSNGFAFHFNEINNNWYLYSGYNRTARDYRFKVFDKDFNQINELLKNNFSDELLPFLENSFFKGNDGILFKESLRPEV
jgi:hypothetical protein